MPNPDKKWDADVSRGGRARGCNPRRTMASLISTSASTMDYIVIPSTADCLAILVTKDYIAIPFTEDYIVIPSPACVCVCVWVRACERARGRVELKHRIREIRRIHRIRDTYNT